MTTEKIYQVPIKVNGLLEFVDTKAEDETDAWLKVDQLYSVDGVAQYDSMGTPIEKTNLYNKEEN